MSSLAGRRIVVTRRLEQSQPLTGALRALGAEVIELPTVDVAPPLDPVPLEAALERLPEFDWVVFTSPNAVLAVRQALSRLRLDNGLGGRLKVACVGAATRRVFQEAWPEAPVCLEPASRFSAEGLLERFAAEDIRRRLILLPLSDLAGEVLGEGLEALGAVVERVTAYRTVVPEGLLERVNGVIDQGFDLIVFASPSAVHGFASAAPGRIRGMEAAVIGPSTETAARAEGFVVRAVAHPSTAEGLVAAIEGCLDTRV